MVTWKFLFIGATILLVYFTYGVASQGGPWAFFVGAAAGSIATYLFTRARDEAAANHNTNTQNVNVSLNQHKVRVGGQAFTEDQYMAIAEMVDRVIERREVTQQMAEPEPMPPLPERQPTKTWSSYIQRTSHHA